MYNLRNFNYILFLDVLNDVIRNSNCVKIYKTKDNLAICSDGNYSND